MANDQTNAEEVRYAKSPKFCFPCPFFWLGSSEAWLGCKCTDPGSMGGAPKEVEDQQSTFSAEKSTKYKEQ